MEGLNKAICFVAKAFEGQKRKGEDYPAVFHSLEAGHIAQTLTKDEQVIIASILHDTVEDTDVTISEIEEKFGKRVAELVIGDTQDQKEEPNPLDTWKARRQEIIDGLNSSVDLGLKIVSLSDTLSNMRSMYRCKQKFGVGLWYMFYQKDPKLHYWYYSSVAKAVSELADTAAYREYVWLIENTFLENER